MVYQGHNSAQQNTHRGNPQRMRLKRSCDLSPVQVSDGVPQAAAGANLDPQMLEQAQAEMGLPGGIQKRQRRQTGHPDQRL